MRYKQKIQQSYITKRMKTNVLAIILSGAVATLAISDAMAQTQNSRSTYFLEGSTYRHELNPAFMGERGYVSLPGLGNLTIGAQSTGGVGDFIFKKANGDLTTFMNEEVSSAEFLKGLPKRLKVGVNVDESILSLGFHAWGGFNTLGISVKSNTNFFMPDELFKFMINGVASETGSSYQLCGNRFRPRTRNQRTPDSRRQSKGTRGIGESNHAHRRAEHPCLSGQMDHHSEECRTIYVCQRSYCTH